MKIVLIIYGISWLILLGVYISHLFTTKGKKKSTFDDNDPWYLYGLIIVLAPLAVLIIPHLLIKSYISDKKSKKRKAEAEEMARQIIEKQKSTEANFKLATQTHGDFVSVARELHSLVNNRKYNEFLTCLNKIKVPDECKFVVDECEALDLGATSKIYVVLPNGEKDENIFDHLIVEPSPMGAWQAYLLKEVWHALPLFWHANYDARDYIFCKEDAAEIGTFREEDRDQIVKDIADFDYTPTVWEKDGEFFVSACYWSDFGGAMREYVAVQFSGNKVTDIYHFNSDTLYEYECGILF